MGAIFRYTLARLRGQILGWGISLALLGAFLLPFYNSLAQQKEQLQNLIKSYPPEMMAFFGDMNQLFTPAGFLNTEFFSYMVIVVGIFAILIGSTLIAGDEEKGTLDLVLAQPVTRTGLFMGRVAAFVLATLLVLAIAWVGFAIVVPVAKIEVGAGALVLPFLSLFAILMVFGALALLLSMLLPSARMAAMLTGVILLASYILSSLALVNSDLKEPARFLPLSYYQGGLAIDGLNWTWFGGLLAAAAVVFLLAWQLFERRDIRVGGEGGWNLPGWRKPIAQSAQKS